MLCQKIFLTNFNLKISKEEIVIYPGPKPALWAVLSVLLDPQIERNRVVACAPTYESFIALPQLTTGNPCIILDTDENCLPNVSKFEEVLSSRTDIACVIINSPNNPSAVVYSIELMKELTDVIKKYPHIAIISDEVYRTILFDNSPYSSPAHFLPNQTIIIGGISKELAGTGLRLGFAAGPKNVIQAMSKLSACTFSCVNLPLQEGYKNFLIHDKNMFERKKLKKF